MTDNVAIRVLRARSRQAQTYSRIEIQPEPEASGYQPRNKPISLPTLNCVYGGRPVTYENGRLMAGDEVVRVRKEGRS